jgi:hypothetical protein
MTLAVDKPILNNPFEEPKEYWIYDEGQPKRMPGRRPGGLLFSHGKKSKRANKTLCFCGDAY